MQTFIFIIAWAGIFFLSWLFSEVLDNLPKDERGVVKYYNITVFGYIVIMFIFVMLFIIASK
jgi:hypothetical protein